MHRFYITHGIDGSNITISDVAQLHHLKDVRRLKAGDEVIVFDGEGNEYLCVISELKTQKAVLAIQARSKSPARKTRVTVACAMPKGLRFDEIVDSLTQLGVDVIIPLETERVIVKLDAGRRETRLLRWRRIARSAAQQSQQDLIPVVEPVTSLESLLSRREGYDVKLMPTLSGERKPVGEILSGSEAGNILVLIGPEGDFTPREIEVAKTSGFVPVSLGNSVLRVNTAATAIVSYIRLSVSG